MKMGKKKGKKRDSIFSSSGLKHQRKINKKIRKLLSKVSRWKRYQDEIDRGIRKAHKKPNRWKTDGLQREISFLESCDSTGTKAKRRRA